MDRGPLSDDDDKLETIDRVVISGTMPDNELEAIRLLVCLAANEPPRRIVTADRRLIAAFLLQISRALALAGYSTTAIYAGILLHRFCHRARLRRPL